MAACRALRRCSSMRTSALSSAHSGPRRWARWVRRSRCSPTPSSRPSCRPARLSALYYADRLNQLPIGVIGIAVGTVLLPEMSRRITASDQAGAHGAAAPRLRFHAAVRGALRRRVPRCARCHHARAVRARRVHQGRCGGGRCDARCLCGWPRPLRADQQRCRDLLCAQGYRDAGKGRADRDRRERRAEDSC